MSVPENTKTLVLNDDYSPLNTVHWKKGIKKVFGESDCEHCSGRGFSGVIEHSTVLDRILCSYCLGKGYVPPAQVVEYYDIWIRDSKGREHPVPAVICNRHHVKIDFKKANFSKLNIYRRDGHRCQYCGKWFSGADLTLDHVVTRSMWTGPDTPTCWHNIVAACLPCNNKKANRTPEQANMPLKKKVGDRWVIYKRPKQANKVELVLGLTQRRIPEEWLPYVKQIMSDQKLDISS